MQFRRRGVATTARRIGKQGRPPPSAPSHLWTPSTSNDGNDAAVAGRAAGGSGRVCGDEELLRAPPVAGQGRLEQTRCGVPCNPPSSCGSSGSTRAQQDSGPGPRPGPGVHRLGLASRWRVPATSLRCERGHGRRLALIARAAAGHAAALVWLRGDRAERAAACCGSYEAQRLRPARNACAYVVAGAGSGARRARIQRLRRPFVAWGAPRRSGERRIGRSGRRRGCWPFPRGRLRPRAARHVAARGRAVVGLAAAGSAPMGRGPRPPGCAAPPARLAFRRAPQDAAAAAPAAAAACPGARAGGSGAAAGSDGDVVRVVAVARVAVGPVVRELGSPAAGRRGRSRVGCSTQKVASFVLEIANISPMQARVAHEDERRVEDLARSSAAC